MGASGSRPPNGEEPVDMSLDQFVLIFTAPPGVGKEELMGIFITENVDSVAYVARIGAVRATQPEPRWSCAKAASLQGLLYFYESASDVAVEPSLDNSYSTILQAMQAALHDGKSIVVDVDSAGARALRQSKVPGCYVFLLPESMDDVRRNIEESLRGDPREAIDRTVAAAEKEISAVDEPDLYDYAVQHDSTAGALEQVRGLADKHGRFASEVLAIESHQQYPRSPLTARDSSGVPSLHHTLSHLHALQPSADASAGSPGGDAAATSGSAASSHKQSKATPPGATAVLAGEQDTGEVAIPAGMQRWQDDVAVVTGATSGVGGAVCEALLDAGMRVVGAAGCKDRLQALQTHVLSRGIAGDMFLPVLCDLRREEEVRALVSIAVKTFSGKPVSVLVAAAAERPAGGGQVMDGDATAWAGMLSANVFATGACCREVCASMRRAGEWGHIVIIGGPSDAADARDTFFSATQCALNGLATGLRREAREAGVPLKVSLVTTAAAADGADDPLATPPAAATDARLPQLSAKSVAATVVSVLAQPPYLDTSEITVRHVADRA